MPKMTDLDFGQALAEAISRRYGTNREFARRMPVDETLVSRWIHGGKEMTRHQLQRAIQVLDDLPFCLAAARYVTGGVLGKTLDAVEGVAGAALCVGKELREMTASLETAHIIAITAPTPDKREQALDVALNLLELATACKEAAARICEGYGFGASTLAVELASRLKSQGYVQEKTRLLPQAA